MNKYLIHLTGNDGRETVEADGFQVQQGMLLLFHQSGTRKPDPKKVAGSKGVTSPEEVPVFKEIAVFAPDQWKSCVKVDTDA